MSQASTSSTARTATVARDTLETQITVSLNLDGSMRAKVMRWLVKTANKPGNKPGDDLSVHELAKTDGSHRASMESCDALRVRYAAERARH